MPLSVASAARRIPLEQALPAQRRDEPRTHRGPRGEPRGATCREHLGARTIGVALALPRLPLQFGHAWRTEREARRPFGRVAESGRRNGLRSRRSNPSGFESRLSHHLALELHQMNRRRRGTPRGLALRAQQQHAPRHPHRLLHLQRDRSLRSERRPELERCRQMEGLPADASAAAIRSLDLPERFRLPQKAQRHHPCRTSGRRGNGNRTGRRVRGRLPGRRDDPFAVAARRAQRARDPEPDHPGDLHGLVYTPYFRRPTGSLRRSRPWGAGPWVASHARGRAEGPAGATAREGQGRPAMDGIDRRAPDRPVCRASGARLFAPAGAPIVPAFFRLGSAQAGPGAARSRCPT